MLRSPTLKTLSLDDLNQRYQGSLINYKDTIRYVQQVSLSMDGKGKPAFLLYNPQVDPGFDENGAGLNHIAKPKPLADQLENARRSVRYWVSQIEKFTKYLDDAVLSPEKRRGFEESIEGLRHSLTLSEGEVARLVVALDRKQDEPAPAEGPILETVDFDAINLERPASGYYQFGDTSSAYLYYLAEKQFCRGFVLRGNCWTTLNNGLRPTVKDLASVLDTAYFKPRLGKHRVHLDDLLKLKPKESWILSSHMAGVRGKEGVEILYRNVNVATLRNDGTVATLQPQFAAELGEVLWGYQADVLQPQRPKVLEKVYANW
jgi:hypothetical protein